MIRALFICSANKLRSPTAEHVFAQWPGVETDSAGLSDSADMVLSREQVEWADVIFVMEQAHRRRFQQKFRAIAGGRKVICLGIPDDYEYMQPELVSLLERTAGPFLRDAT